MQVVVYCGLPAANQAFKLAKETFAEMEASA
jgi:alkylhydroperoxidase/carboxymuconolactone decarboxylase family protein YurZ